MNRRGFLGAMGAFVAAPIVGVPPRTTARSAPCGATVEAPAPLKVERANGCKFILGVATETVRAGDLVQIQTYGPATVRIEERP